MLDIYGHFHDSIGKVFYVECIGNVAECLDCLKTEGLNIHRDKF